MKTSCELLKRQCAKWWTMKTSSELLKLLNSRKSWELPPWRQPRWDAKDSRTMEVAAQAYGEAYPSDPFARQRISLYMEKGYEHMDDVLKEGNRVLLARRAALLKKEEKT